MNFLREFFIQSRLSIFFVRRILFESRKKHSIGAILSMALGILPLILVQEVSIGMIEGMSKRIIETSLYHISAQNFQDIVYEDFDAIMQEIADEEQVQAVYRELNASVVVQSNTTRKFALLRGLDTSLIAPETNFSQYIEILDGARSFTHEGSPAALIAATLARSLSLAVGDTIQLLSVNTARGSGIPRVSRVVIGGIFTTGLQEIERNWILVSNSNLARAFPPRSTQHTIGINVTEPYAIQNDLLPEFIPDRSRTLKRNNYDHLQQRIAKILSPRWQIRTWSERGSGRFSRLRQTRTTLIVLMAFVLIVSSLTIATFLLRMATELAPQFAILRLMGMSIANARLCMVYFSLICGIWSVLVSFGIALVLLTYINEILYAIGALASIFMPNSENIFVASSEFYLETIPVTISFFRLFTISLSVCILTVLSGWYSAKKLAKITKTKVLQV